MEYVGFFLIFVLRAQSEGFGPENFLILGSHFNSKYLENVLKSNYPIFVQSLSFYTSDDAFTDFYIDNFLHTTKATSKDASKDLFVGKILDALRNVLADVYAIIKDVIENVFNDKSLDMLKDALANVTEAFEAIFESFLL